MMRVKTKEIVFYERLVLHESELHLSKGKLTVLKGPSGSGKSTIVKAIASKNDFLDKLSYDEVCIDRSDKDMYNAFIDEHMTLVAQDIRLLTDLTVSAHIDLYMELFHPDHDLEECKRLLNIDSLLERYPLQLSGGEQRRVGLLLAVLKDSEVLILDEPTASLDAEHAEGVLQLIKQLTETGKTVFVTSHDKKVIEKADVLYAIIQKKIQLIKSGNEETCEYKKEWVRPDRKIVQKYLRQTYSHHETYHKLYRIFTVVCISMISLCTQFEHYVSIRNGGSLSDSISNQIIVYHQNKGIQSEYNYDGVGIPITEKDAEAIKKLDHVSGVSYRADVCLNDRFALYAKEKFDENLNFDITIEYPEQQKKVIPSIEYNSLIMSSYMEGEDYSKSIKEDFHQPGVYISSIFAAMIKDPNYELKDTKISLNLLLPEYQVDGQYIVDGTPVTASVCTKVPVELSIAGVLEGASMGPPVLYANVLYFSQSELESYVEKSRKQEGEVIIIAQEEDPVTFEYKRVDFYNEITDEIKQAGYTNFYTVNYTPWQPAAYTVVVDQATNVDEVMQEITMMGYDVLYEDFDYHTLSQGAKQLQELARMVSVICMFIIICVFILMKYNDREKEQEENEFFYDIGFGKDEVRKIKKRKSIEYARRTFLYTIITIGVIIQIDHLLLHLGLNFHVMIFVMALVLVVFMDVVVPMVFEWRNQA